MRQRFSSFHLLVLGAVGFSIALVVALTSSREPVPGPDVPEFVAGDVERDALAPATPAAERAASLPDTAMADRAPERGSPQRTSVDTTSAPLATPGPAEARAPRSAPTPAPARSRPADADAAGIERHASGLPYRDVFEIPEARAALEASIPGMGECHRLLMELDDGVPPALTLRLEALVRVDERDRSRARIELQYVNSDELELEDTACFAEVFDQIEMAAPADGQEYAFRAWTSTRVETDDAPSE